MDKDKMVYSSISERLWDKAEEVLGLREQTEGREREYVDAFMMRCKGDGNHDNVFKRHNLLLEPASKVSRPSHASFGHVKPLSNNKKKKLGLTKLSKKEQRYHLYEPLHQLWMKYIKDLLRPSPSSNCISMANKILKADLHGCHIKVIKSPCISCVGHKGIIIRETKNTFNIISVNDKIRIIPKSGTIFQFVVGDHTFTLYGKHLRHRASERSSRKMKQKTLFVKDV